jgi:hypothetical protein
MVLEFHFDKMFRSNSIGESIKRPRETVADRNLRETQEARYSSRRTNFSEHEENMYGSMLTNTFNGETIVKERFFAFARYIWGLLKHYITTLHHRSDEIEQRVEELEAHHNQSSLLLARIHDLEAQVGSLTATVHGLPAAAAFR